MSKKVLLLGGDGYIGSVFSNTRKDITSIDIGWFSHSESMDFNSLDKDFISNFSDIVLLAGHSSVLMCKGDFVSTFNNNIRNFGSLLNKIDNQKIIYASSSSIYNGCVGQADETFTEFKGTNEYDISKYTIDLLARMSKKNYYGLRFGTVNGPSNNMRWELMINKMVIDSIMTGNITLYNKDVRRPILNIETIPECINLIIDSDKILNGYYNLCNTNSTIGQYAFMVKSVLKQELGLDINIIDNGNTETYDFAMSNKKFSETYNYSFDEDLKPIISKLAKIKYNGGNRNDKRVYK
jgi:nucleoside-diphosphate-sugar epimerase